VRRDIDDLREQLRGLVLGAAVAQVFVDLPHAAAVQLVFRAEPGSDERGRADHGNEFGEV
jgi:hypothetical protein